MKNLRNSFTEDDFPKKELPVTHKDEFLEKLGNMPSAKKYNYRFMKIAAVFVLLVGLAFVFVQQNATDDEEEVNAVQITKELKKVETEYLANINTEWKNFLAVATDEKLIRRYKQKLTQLDADYKQISKEFKADKNNLFVVEDLIRNLQTRLSLLKDIQEHIKILNAKKDQNETTI
ncbi:hypothetical protein Q4599_09490 [Cellulophaga lytica]|uniref:hypothetical protein n=1 Tax=Cellulophaga lytica TaxID=979 RepID=UPI0026E462BC|nr:hypothetical protein [Cellulophaga lytica]MDO6853813.1 hypothetical protein [Cellulophaga lytica]